MEIQAAARYRELARRMRLHQALDPSAPPETRTLALLFETLAATEDEHAAQVERWDLGATAKLPDAHIQTPMGEGLDSEVAESQLLTPYDALAEAVRAEMRNFTTFSYLAAETTDTQIRRMSEALAKEELAHAALLRRERRKAFHAHRRKSSSPLVGGRMSLQALWRASCESEARAASYHRALADSLNGRPAVAAAFRRIADDEAVSAVEAATISGRRLPEHTGSPRPSLAGGLKLLEVAFERYAHVAAQATEEAAMLTAQHLAERSLGHLQTAYAALKDRTDKASRAQ